MRKFSLAIFALVLTACGDYWRLRAKLPAVAAWMLLMALMVCPARGEDQAIWDAREEGAREQLLRDAAYNSPQAVEARRKVEAARQAEAQQDAARVEAMRHEAQHQGIDVSPLETAHSERSAAFQKTFDERSSYSPRYDDSAQRAAMAAVDVQHKVDTVQEKAQAALPALQAAGAAWTKAHFPHPLVTPPPQAAMPPSWHAVEQDPKYQAASSKERLAAFKKWHDWAYNYCVSQPDWNKSKDAFNNGAAKKEAELTKAANEYLRAHPAPPEPPPPQSSVTGALATKEYFRQP